MLRGLPAEPPPRACWSIREDKHLAGKVSYSARRPVLLQRGGGRRPRLATRHLDFRGGLGGDSVTAVRAARAMAPSRATEGEAARSPSRWPPRISTATAAGSGHPGWGVTRERAVNQGDGFSPPVTTAWSQGPFSGRGGRRQWRRPDLIPAS
jgi:hypothetical protein